jgi:hypothetical protein
LTIVANDVAESLDAINKDHIHGRKSRKRKSLGAVIRSGGSTARGVVIDHAHPREKTKLE